MPNNNFRFDVRVYYEDTDSGGIVYYANYLKFAERARTEVLRSAGINQTDLLASDSVAFAVRKCHIDFHKPARLDDLLTIHTKLEEIGNASLVMQQTIMKEQTVLVSMTVKLAVIGPDMKPAKLPAHVREGFAQHVE
ncbi:MAG: tol-pal system-associated acyl-CoA thioesterase [Alphaproteobacteria bacterium]